VKSAPNERRRLLHHARRAPHREEDEPEEIAKAKEMPKVETGRLIVR